MILSLDNLLILFLWPTIIEYLSLHLHLHHMHKLYKEISDKIAQYNTNYKLQADIWKIFKTCNVGDIKKLYARSAGPFQILKKLNDNASVIYLSKYFGINSSFNVENLMDYKVSDLILATHWLMSFPLSLFFKAFPTFTLIYFTWYSNNINKILDDKTRHQRWWDSKISDLLERKSTNW